MGLSRIVRRLSGSSLWDEVGVHLEDVRFDDLGSRSIETHHVLCGVPVIVGVVGVGDLS